MRSSVFFERRLQEISSDLDGVMGYAVVDLTSGERFGHLEQQVFPTASTIKLAIVYELFKRADEGTGNARSSGRRVRPTTTSAGWAPAIDTAAKLENK